MRLGREDWLQTGLQLLRRTGPDTLTIDRLCRRLKVTKGSFYHHFSGRDDFLQALMEYWRHIHTESLIAFSETVAPEKRSEALSQLTRSAEAGIENAMRSWALQDPDVARQVDAVDRVRVDYLQSLIAARLLPGQDVQLVAKLIYAHFVGVQHLSGLINAEEWAAMDALLQKLLTPQ